MKRSIRVPVFVLFLLLGLTACSARSGGASDAAAPVAAPLEQTEMSTGADTTGDHAAEELAQLDGVNQTTGEKGSGGDSVYSHTDAKLIRKADLSVQTTEFDQAVEALNKLVEQQGGYFEQAEVQGGGYYDKNAQRYGSYVIRVPKDDYETFLAATEGVGHVVSRNESSTDIGAQYFDTEAQLKTQKTKRDRLQSLLEKAESMEDIIQLEGALADVEYQIEQFSSTLRRYDSLVGYATINLYLEEVRKISDEPAQTDGLGVRMAAAFSDGASRFGRRLENLAVQVAYDFFGILIFAVLMTVVVIVLVRIRKRRRKWAAVRNAEADVPNFTPDQAPPQREQSAKPTEEEKK